MEPYWKNHTPPERTEAEKKKQELAQDIETLVQSYMEDTGQLPRQIDLLLNHQVTNGEETYGVLAVVKDERDKDRIAEEHRHVERANAEEVYEQRLERESVRHSRLIDGEVVEVDEEGNPLGEER